VPLPETLALVSAASTMLAMILSNVQSTAA
jgi:hypothetical protein